MCKLHQSLLCVAALRCIKNNIAFLHPVTGDVSCDLRLIPVSRNPYMHPIVRLTGCFHVVPESTEIISTNPCHCPLSGALAGATKGKQRRGCSLKCNEELSTTVMLGETGHSVKCAYVNSTSQKHTSIQQFPKNFLYSTCVKGKRTVILKYLRRC